MIDDTGLVPAMSLDEAVGIAREMLAGSWASPDQARRVVKMLDRFRVFADVGFGVVVPAAVTSAVAEAFVRAPHVDGAAPTVSMMHFRRSALRLLFRSLRDAGLAVGDPTLDLELPARSQLSSRPLTDDEVTLCRSHALWSLSDSRRAAAWALAEATCRSVEVAQIRVVDVDIAGERVRIHGGRTTAARWGALTSWGLAQLERRIAILPGNPQTPVVYGGTGGPATGQVSACVAIVDVLTRAGLGAEADVRPASVAAWAGQRIVAETGRIDEAARRLGMSSLDRTARFIGFDWRTVDQ